VGNRGSTAAARGVPRPSTCALLQLQPALVVPDAAWASSTTHSLDLQGRVAGSADFDGDGLTDVAVLVGEDPAVLGLWLSGG
jgi:hypothetical protein